MKRISLYAVAGSIDAMKRIKKSGNLNAMQYHEPTIETANDNLPHGSGLDGKVYIMEDESTKDKIVIFCEFHHMNENGYYDGWTEHRVIITPTFDGFDIKITGRNRNDIKDYLSDLFSNCFTSQYITPTSQNVLIETEW